MNAPMNVKRIRRKIQSAQRFEELRQQHPELGNVDKNEIKWAKELFHANWPAGTHERQLSPKKSTPRSSRILPHSLNQRSSAWMRSDKPSAAEPYDWSAGARSSLGRHSLRWHPQFEEAVLPFVHSPIQLPAVEVDRALFGAAAEIMTMDSDDIGPWTSVRDDIVPPPTSSKNRSGGA